MSNHDLKRIKKRVNGKDNSFNSFFSIFLNKLLITGLITIICLIFLRRNSNFKSFFYDKVLGVNFNFAYVNGLYQKYFGGSIPFSVFLNSTETVFNESLSYSDSSSYLDGVSLDVGDNYLVPSLESGLVIFVGEKEGYGNTIIVEGADGVNIWYSNMENVSVDMYQYISKGSFVGECNNKLFLVFKKDGNVLDYQEYI